MTIAQLRKAILLLHQDEQSVQPGKWYRSQKEHWLGWLREYHTSGAYGRQTKIRRDAEYAYNHIVEWRMLVYLAWALGVENRLVSSARRSAERAGSMQSGAAAVRKLIPWSLVEPRLRKVPGQ